MGRVGAAVVTAAFFNFEPGMVARAVPGCWEVVAPAALCRVRATAAAEALGELCGTAARSSLVGALPLLRRAVAGCRTEGRVLAAANATLWPAVATAPGAGGLGEAWQACTTLREHRGDGHVAALVCAGLSGTEAHLLAAATKGIASEVLRESRGWSAAAWGSATAALCRRGLLHADGRATDFGRTLSAEVEARTDRLAEPATVGLSDGALEDLYGALLAGAAEVAATGVIPYPNPMGLPPAPSP